MNDQNNEMNEEQDVTGVDESKTTVFIDEIDTSDTIGVEVSAADGELEDVTFSELGLYEDILAAVNSVGWTKPTPVQALCLPHTLKKLEVAGFAQTGTGKTGVFLLTIAQQFLERKMRLAENDDTKKPGTPFAVILAPTRELAMQIQADAEQILDKVGIRSVAVFGGVDYDKQAKLIKDGAEVIVATPGRLKDYFQKKTFTFDHCEVFVCDEADRMFDMGFIEDVEFFFSALKENCQKLLFSATTNEKVKELAFEYLEKPRYISVNPESLTPENIEQHAVICRSDHKLRVLMGMFRDHQPKCAVMFVNTKLVAEWLHHKLTHNGIDADLITGDLPQRKRINLIKRIKEGKIKALVATDVASRGLHISDLSHVYNFDLPDEPANYVHRIGRTARAGASGRSYSLVCEDYGQNLTAINELLGEELALKSEWYDERYLQIEDKAVEPFVSKASAGSEHRQRNERDGRRGGASGARQDKAQKRGGRDGDREPRASRQERGPRGKTTDQRADGASKQRKRPRRQRGRDRRPEHSSDQVSFQQQPAVAAVEPPKTVGGIIKRFFSALIGRK